MQNQEVNLAGIWNGFGIRVSVICRSIIAVTTAICYLMLLHGTSTAAEIQKSTSENCVIEISGVIVSGDLEKIQRAADRYFPKDIIESTFKNVVCLNSRGGSLVEGIKIAKYFYKNGVGTTIDKDQACLSVCALMFMMGAVTGSEVGGSHRSLHVKGVLGFHRPSLGLRLTGTFSPQEVTRSFDLALDSAIEFLVLANNITAWTNKPVMPPDLIQNIFSHKGNDFYYIDTINKVGRWDIDLYGLEYPKKLDENHAYLVCENLSRWPVGLIKDLRPLEENNEYNPDAVSVIARKNSTLTYRIYGSNSGLVEHLCIVQFDDDSILVCGHDESTDTRIGRGSCDEKNYSEKLGYVEQLYSLLHPDTKLRDLAYEQPKPKREPPVGDGARCYVINSTAVIDEEPCTIITENDKKHIMYFVWPSGSKTVVVGRGPKVKINGVDSIARMKDGFDVCYFNKKSGNDFCYKTN